MPDKVDEFVINGHAIKVDDLIKQYRKEYSHLCEHGMDAIEYQDAIAFGDAMIDMNLSLVRRFCARRSSFRINGVSTTIFDPLSSDREVAAFGIALSKLAFENLGALRKIGA